MKINLKELRIGNILNCNDISCSVVQINNEIVVLENSPKKLRNFRYSSKDLIVPFELTKKELLMFNFRDVDGDGMYMAFDNMMLTAYGIKLPKTEWKYRGSFGGYEVKVDYVHQLQNLYYALTGEELKGRIQITTGTFDSTCTNI